MREQIIFGIQLTLVMTALFFIIAVIEGRTPWA